MVTSILSATWFYHLPLIDLRLVPKGRKQSAGLRHSSAALLPPLPGPCRRAQLPWAPSSLLPSPASPTGALCTAAPQTAPAPCQAALQSTSIVPAKRHKPLQGSSGVRTSSLGALPVAPGLFTGTYCGANRVLA